MPQTSLQIEVRKLAWHRDRSVPQGQKALGSFDCPCGEPIEDVEFGGEDHACKCGIVVDGHGWIKS